MKYWHRQGRHQKIYERLQNKLVPDTGEADTEAGEIIRAIGNVVYDIGNDGGCNLNSGRKSDLDRFTGYLQEFGFESTSDLREQLTGLAEETPEPHCRTCDCVDDHKQYPPLDENLFDSAVDLLVMEANRLDRRKRSTSSE